MSMNPKAYPSDVGGGKCAFVGLYLTLGTKAAPMLAPLTRSLQQVEMDCTCGGTMEDELLVLNIDASNQHILRS